MRIHIEHEGRVVDIKDDAVTGVEVLKVICSALVALSFHPDTIKDAICELAEENL